MRHGERTVWALLRSIIATVLIVGNLSCVFRRLGGSQSRAQLEGAGPITSFSEPPAMMSSYRITGIVSGFPFKVAD